MGDHARTTLVPFVGTGRQVPGLVAILDGPDPQRLFAQDVVELLPPRVERPRTGADGPPFLSLQS
jgi:hypothetical protein